MTIFIKKQSFLDAFNAKNNHDHTSAIKQIDKDLDRGFKIVMDGVTYTNTRKVKSGKKFYEDLVRKELLSSQTSTIMNIAHQGLFAPLTLQGSEVASRFEIAEWRQDKPAATILIFTQDENITVSSEIDVTIGRPDLDAEDMNTLISVAKYKARIEANLSQNIVLVTHKQQSGTPPETSSVKAISSKSTESSSDTESLSPKSTDSFLSRSAYLRLPP